MKVLVLLAVFVGLSHAQTHPPIGCSVDLNCMDQGEFIEDNPAQSEEECMKYCHANNQCWYYTFYPDYEICAEFRTCPSQTACNSCTSGDRECHQGILCNRPGECEGITIGATPKVTAEECVQQCNDNTDCMWFSYNYADNACIFFSTCDHNNDCPTCVYGETGCEPSEVTPPAARGTTVSPRR